MNDDVSEQMVKDVYHPDWDRYFDQMAAERTTYEYARDAGVDWADILYAQGGSQASTWEEEDALGAAAVANEAASVRRLLVVMHEMAGQPGMPEAIAVVEALAAGLEEAR